MPELPDIVAYVKAVRERVEGHAIEHIRIASPFLLRSVSPPLSVFEGATIVDVGRLLADRALSRLLREDWPRNLDEMEQHLAERRA